MSLYIHVNPGATDDIRGAVVWYNEQRPGLGDEFRDELDRSFDAILANPRAAISIRGRIRRALLHRFPYGVFYSIEPDRIVIHAVIDLRRDPDLWPRGI